MRAGVTGFALWVALFALACGPPPPPPSEPASPAEKRPEDFSGERAAAHLEALASIGPRPAASEGAQRAREYIAGSLRGLDVEVVEQRTRVEGKDPVAGVETVNLFATIPGASPDAILLVAPYDSPADARDGASGAALVLELGRALQASHPAYTVWLAFVEGDALAPGASRAAAKEIVGTRALVAGLGGGGGDRLARVRVAVYFDRVAEPDLRVARDLLSNRTWREEFWASARRLGHTAAFPPDAAFESVDAGQRAFFAVGMRRAVVIAAARQAGAPPGGQAKPGQPKAEPAAKRSDAGRSAESLAVVGAVSLDALVAISERLAKIDRFVGSPVASSEEDGEASEDSKAGDSPR